jgi:exopolyphosphatase/guanosine-5'-triphosphate,3'-diphosphate pyrophosphatase
LGNGCFIKADLFPFLKEKIFMKVAILDLGTNTFNILIVDLLGADSYKVLFQNKLAVKLGEGGINDGIIRATPFQRGINALREHKATIEANKVEKVYAFATSAIRDASNGKDFIHKVKEEVGIDIDVISGHEEAELIYFGVRSAVQLSSERSLIIDIGGGSTEFIIANKDEIFWKHSFKLGAARLLDRFKPSDPITDEQVNAINDFLREELKPLTEQLEQLPVVELVGSSGSFDSLAEMISYRFYTPDVLRDVTEFEFNLSDCNTIYEELLKTTREERLQIRGLIEMRVDMIVVSSILVHHILTNYHIRRMRLSTYALKEGVLEKLLRSQE